MHKWEYRVERIFAKKGVVGLRGPEAVRASMMQQLNEIGADGWELVHLYWEKGKMDNAHVVFKRPKQDD